MGDFSRGKWVTFLVGEIIDISLSMESLLLREKYPFSLEVKLRIFFHIFLAFLLNPSLIILLKLGIKVVAFFLALFKF